jgi:selenocysteine lyase/cysteine desulfurase
MDNGRKEFLIQLGSGIALATLPGMVSAAEHGTDAADFTGISAADDEKSWKQIARKYYDVSRDYINLENGYYGIQPKPVLEAFRKNVIKANQQAARFARKEFPSLSSSIKKELAAFLDVSDEEIIITRNATEALNIAIQGYPFKPGDEVLLNQLDYFSMIEAFQMLEKRGQIKVNNFEMPLLPANEDEIVEIYRNKITARTKVILLTHVSNINGLIVPVAKIAAMAKAKGIDTITDSAHALGQVPFSLPGLGSDFVGLNLHKWIGNPIGAGVLYVKKDRIKEMKPLLGDVNTAETSISKLAHFGTTPFSVIMTIPDSLAFHKMMGVERVSARLHYLSSVWMNELRQNAKVEIVTPGDSKLSCAIASFRIKDKPSTEIADKLFKEHNVLTVARSLGKQGCIRVTPAVYNSVEDVKKLVIVVNSL